MGGCKYTKKTCGGVVVRKEESIYNKTARERAPVHLSPITIKGIIERTFEHAMAEANKHGECTIAGMLKLKLVFVPEKFGPFDIKPTPAKYVLKAVPFKKLSKMIKFKDGAVGKVDKVEKKLAFVCSHGEMA